jgi:hypothetical protein
MHQELHECWGREHALLLAWGLALLCIQTEVAAVDLKLFPSCGPAHQLLSACG